MSSSTRRRYDDVVVGEVFVGISGYDYASWRGRFYPRALAKKRWLAHAAAALNSIELNGTFYSLKSASSFRAWAAAVPDNGFVFAIKGGRFITHVKKLKDVAVAVANFFAQGVLALGNKTGPFLWQLPESLAYDEERLERFFELLPRDSREGASLAHKHDARVKEPLVSAPRRAPVVAYRHALEPRHASFFTRRAHDLLRAYDIAFVAADSAGRFPISVTTTASFAYARLHGSTELYASGYRDDELATWAARIKRWRKRGDVYVYFDNDARGHAPFDAMRLAALVAGPVQETVSERSMRSNA